MNEIKLKQIKRMWTDLGRQVPPWGWHLTNDEIDFLFAEIERLTEVDNRRKFMLKAEQSCNYDLVGEVERKDELCDAWIDVAVERTIKKCIDIVEEKTKYLSCTKDGHGIADAIRKEFGE